MPSQESAKRRRINPFSLLVNESQTTSERQAHDGEGDASSARHKPGNIISLRVWNFTTYAYGEFHLSPSLNMIIGPNGSGKSTFVAAVCLGLGGKVDLIKRKSMDSMIKSGENESTIEIVMKNEQGHPNVVIERKFARKLNKSHWRVNGAPSNIVDVRTLVSKFSIQLDNLCHFLPQERVAEFASLSLEKLLLETERTIGDNTLLDRHKQLIELNETWAKLSKDVAILEEQIVNIQTDVEKFELEAQKFEEYQEKSRQIDLHKKVLPYAQLQDMKDKLKHLRLERDAAKKALQEFQGITQPLKVLMAKVEKRLERAAQAHDELKETFVLVRIANERQTTKVENMTLGFSAVQNEIESLKSRTESQKRELEQSEKEKDELVLRLLAMGSIDVSKVLELTSKRQEKYEEKMQIEEDFDTVKMSYNALRRDINMSEQTYKEERKKLDNNNRLEILRTRGLRYRRELMENAYEAHTLLRRERTPDMKYYEAPVVCCRITDRRYARYFEKVVDNNSLFAFFFENEDQYKAVSSLIPKHVNVPMRVVGNSPSLKQPMSLEELRNMDFDGYLSDFITGPEPVIRGLEQRSLMHCIPVSLNLVSPQVMKKLLEPDAGGRTLFRRFIVGDDLFVINQSKYGSRQVFYQTERIANAQLMGAEGISEDVKREIQERVVGQREKIKEMHEKMASIETKKVKFLDNIMKVEEEMCELDLEIKSIRKKQEAKLRLEAHVTHLEGHIRSLIKSINHDHSKQIREKETELLELYVTYAEATKKGAEITAQLVTESVNLKKAEILQQQIENEGLCYTSLMKELESKQNELKDVYDKAKAKCGEYKQGNAAEEIRRQNPTPEERTALKNMVQKYMDDKKLCELYVVTKIGQLEDDLSVLANVDRGSLELLKAKRIDLEVAERKLPELTENRDVAKAQIDEIFSPWEKELSSMVENISKAFRKRFVTVASDGHVELVKLERFKDWKLEIMVKFRENAELKVLDHQSQSGGERAVSTIFFIMSLQGLTKAPIRIVDEINQGMDPKNEKLAHKYLVDTACKNGQSQYFLVTPKLLPGLYYHPEMTIHCIFTGPFLNSNSPSKAEKGFLNFQQIRSVRA